MIELLVSDNIEKTPDFLKPINDIVKNLGLQYKKSITGLGVTVEYNWRDDRVGRVGLCGSFEAGVKKNYDDATLTFIQFPIVFLQKQDLGDNGIGVKTDHFYAAEFEVRYRRIHYEPTNLGDRSAINATELIQKLKDRIEAYFAASSEYVCLTDLADYPEIRGVFRSWDY